MKHLKTYENLQYLKRWNLILSDENFKKYASEFDLIIEPFLEYADEGYDLTFETAYGTRVYMKYQDYLDKNEKYQEFIHGLPGRGLDFKSNISIPYDYQKLQTLLEEIQASIDRLGGMGWTLLRFTVGGSVRNRRISVSHEFEKKN